VTSVGVGDTAEVILAETSLYPESGGQVADQGTLVGPGLVATVVDVQRPVSGLISHTVRIDQGELAVGQSVEVLVDEANRRRARQAHSATHLIHAALRDTLGPHATQAGSLNRSGYMRLDFSWTHSLAAEQKLEIEAIANRAIHDDLEVSTRVLPIDEAKSLGAMALFGEKYGDTVRMVDIGGPWSRELCAGTHVSSSAQIGVINLVHEASISAGARRVEALVGMEALHEFSRERELVAGLQQTLKAPRAEIPGRIDELLNQVRQMEKTIESLTQKGLGAVIERLAPTASAWGPVSGVVARADEVASADDLRHIAQNVLQRMGSGAHAVALGADISGRATIVVVASAEAVDGGVHAGNLVKESVAMVGGGGGGKPQLAQGGGPDAAGLDQALETVRQRLSEL